MGQPVLVRAGDVEFYAEVTETGGPQTVGLDDALSFDGVRSTVRAICSDLVHAWEAVKPTEATAEFALRLTARSGKLTGMLVDAGGEASLRVTLTWRDQQAS